MLFAQPCSWGPMRRTLSISVQDDAGAYKTEVDSGMIVPYPADRRPQAFQKCLQSSGNRAIVYGKETQYGLTRIYVRRLSGSGSCPGQMNLPCQMTSCNLCRTKMYETTLKVIVSLSSCANVIRTNACSTSQ